MTLSPKLKTKKKTARRVDVKQAIASVTEDELLSGAAVRLPIDVHPSLKKKLKTLSTNTIHPDPSKNTVTMRMLVTEALSDLFAKYDRGDGDYRLDED